MIDCANRVSSAHTAARARRSSSPGVSLDRQHELVGDRRGDAAVAVVVGRHGEVLRDHHLGVVHDQHDLERDRHGDAVRAGRVGVRLVDVEDLVALGPHQREGDVVGHRPVGGGDGERLVVALGGREGSVEREHPGLGRVRSRARLLGHRLLGHRLLGRRSVRAGLAAGHQHERELRGPSPSAAGCPSRTRPPAARRRRAGPAPRIRPGPRSVATSAPTAGRAGSAVSGARAPGARR